MRKDVENEMANLRKRKEAWSERNPIRTSSVLAALTLQSWLMWEKQRESHASHRIYTYSPRASSFIHRFLAFLQRVSKIKLSFYSFGLHFDFFCGKTVRCVQKAEWNMKFFWSSVARCFDIFEIKSAIICRITRIAPSTEFIIESQRSSKTSINSWKHVTFSDY